VVKRLWLIPALALAMGVAAGQELAGGGYPLSDKQPQTRLLQGQVMNGEEKPLPEAVVYLKNTKTMTVKTFITEKDGSYRFPALSPNVDYEVYAEHNGRKSDTKTLSSFDSRKIAYINLKIK
jgi:protocatechuate 3,4-dioxygenase beta subunit